MASPLEEALRGLDMPGAAEPEDDLYTGLDGLDLPVSPEPTEDQRLRANMIEGARVDSSAFAKAERDAPPGVAPQAVMRTPEAFQAPDLERNLETVNQRGALRRQILADAGLPSMLDAPTDYDRLARAYDDVGITGLISRTVSASGDEFKGNLLLIEGGARAMPEIFDALYGTSLSSEENKARITETLEAQGELHAAQQQLPIVLRPIALGFGQTPFVAGALGSGYLGGKLAGLAASPLAGIPYVGKGLVQSAQRAGETGGRVFFTGMVEGGSFFNGTTRERPDFDRSDVAVMSIFVGGINGALELVPLDQLSRTTTGAAARVVLRRKAMTTARKLLADRKFRDLVLPAMKNVLLQMGSEGVTEFLQEIPQILGVNLLDVIDGNVDMEEAFLDLASPESVERYREAALVGALGAGGISVAGSVVGTTYGAIQSRNANANRELFQQIADTSLENADLIERMPSRYKKLVDDAAEEGGRIEGVYVTPAALTQAFDGNAEGMAALIEAIPDLEQRIGQAADLDAKVRFSPGEFATYLAGAAEFEALADHFSFGADQESLSEANELASAESIARVVERLKSLSSSAEVDPLAAQETEKDFATNLEAIFDESFPAVNKQVRKQSARALSRIVTNLAKLDGQDPLELAVDLLDRVGFEQRPELDSPAEVARTDEFARGGNVLRQPSGQPLAAAVTIDGQLFEGPTHFDAIAEALSAGAFDSEWSGPRSFSDLTDTEQDALLEIVRDRFDYEEGFSTDEGFLDRDAATERFGVDDSTQILKQKTDDDPATGSSSEEHLLNVQREKRKRGEKAQWAKGERAAVKAAATEAGMPVKDAVAYVTQQKLDHPASERWVPWVFGKIDVKKVKNKAGKTVTKFKILPQVVPYSFDRGRDGTALEGRARAKAVDTLASRTLDEILKVFHRAKSGDREARVILRQADWYKALRARLRREFGGLGDLMADLLGATSPNTPVRLNWTSSVEALRLASSGEFDELIDSWEQWVEDIEYAEADLRQWLAEQQAQRLPREDVESSDAFRKRVAKIEAMPAKLEEWLNSRVEKELEKGKKTREEIVEKLTTSKPYLKRLGDIDRAPAELEEWVEAQRDKGHSKADIKATAEYKKRKKALSEIRALDESLLPRKSNGALFGFNGQNVARAMVNLWRVVKTADDDIGQGTTAPKAVNFSGNLIGYREKATIDVWAARFLQRLRHGNKIASAAEGAVAGFMLPGGETSGQFRFGQDVMDAAVALIRADPTLSTDKEFSDLASINPDDLQAVVWFVEKEIWARESITSAEGEGGSFEFEADLTGSTQEDLIADLRRIINSSKSTAAERKAASQELDALRRTVDRFVAGGSIQQSAEIQGTDFVPNDGEMAAVSTRIKNAIYAAGDAARIVGSKVASTLGLYGDPERSFDVEVVAKEGYDPATLMRELVQVGQEAQQDSVFLSRVLRDGEDYDPKIHRPGIEVYFRESKPMEEIQPILDEINKILPGGYTVVVDGRRSGEFRDGAMPPVVGIRAQYIPEFDVRYGETALLEMDDEQIAAHMEKQADKLESDAADILADVQGVTFAGTFWHETDVRFLGEYADILNEGEPNAEPTGAGQEVDRAAGSGWQGRPVREGAEAAARRIEQERAAKAGDPAARGDSVFKQRTGDVEEAVADHNRRFFQRARSRAASIFKMTAWHGGPHDHDGFSNEFIGTGEGAQAYGWGLYFSSMRAIAEWYRNKLAPATVKFRGRVVPPNKNGMELAAEFGIGTKEASALATISARNGDVASVRRYFESLDSTLAPEVRFYVASLDAVSEDVSVEGRGRVFEVNIPEDSELMDWDAPLSEQPEIAAKLRQIEATRRSGMALDQRLSEMSTEEIGRFLFAMDSNGEFFIDDEFLEDYADGEGADGEPTWSEEALERADRDFREQLLDTVREMDQDGEVSEYSEDSIFTDGESGRTAYDRLALRLGSPRAASEAMSAAGVKGHKYQSGRIMGGTTDGTNYVIYDDQAISIAQKFYQRKVEKGRQARTRGQLVVDRVLNRFLLQLSEGEVNDATLIHEIGHLVLELTMDMAEAPGASQGIIDYRDQIWALFGVSSREEITTEHHESLAESLELYLREGKAPSDDMRGLFAFFRRRLVRIYATVKDRLLNANHDMAFTPLFDRLFEADEAITRAAEQNPVMPAFSEADMTLLNDEERETILSRTRRIREAERAKEERAVAREQARIQKAQHSELRDQITLEVMAERVQKLRHWLKRGVLPDGSALESLSVQRLSAADVDALTGGPEFRIQKLPRGTWQKVGGWHPEKLANGFGYATPEEMLDDLAASEDPKAIISRRLKAESEEAGLTKTPEELEDVAWEILDGPQRNRLYEAERRVARRLRAEEGLLRPAQERNLAGEQAPAAKDVNERVQAAQAALDEAIDRQAPEADLDVLQADLAAARDLAQPARVARNDQAAAKRNATPARVPTQIFQRAAQQVVGETRVRDLPREVRTWLSARKKAGQKKVDAAVARDWEEMEARIDQEQHANALVDVGSAAKASVAKWRTYLKSFDKKGSNKRRRMLKHANETDESGITTNYMDVIDGLLALVDLKQRSATSLDNAAAILRFAERSELERGIVIPVPPWVQQLSVSPSFKDMTVQQFEEIYYSVRALEKHAMDLVRSAEQNLAEAEEVELEDMRGQLATRPTHEVPEFAAREWTKKKKSAVGVVASLISFQTVVDYLDNLNPEGPFNRAWMHLIRNSARNERDLKKRGSTEVNAAWSNYTAKEQRDFYHVLIPIESMGGAKMNKNEILAVAANMGNEHNRAALFNSSVFPLSEATLDEILSHVNEKDAVFLDAVLETLDGYWAEASAMEREMNGVVPPKVEAEPWQLPNGRWMRGGYFPMDFNSDISERANEYEDRETMKGLVGSASAHAMTTHGHLKARLKTSGGLTVRPDFMRTISKHINQVSKDTAWRPTIVKLARQFKKLEPELKPVIGTEFYRELRPYLQRLASDHRNGDTAHPWLNAVASHSRSGLSLVAMSWRVASAAIQASGFLPAIPRVGAINVLAGYRDIYFGNAFRNIEEMRVLVPELRDRAERFDREAQQEALRLNPIDIRHPARSEKAIKAFAMHYGFYLLGAVDTFTATAVARGAMRQAMSGQIDGVRPNDVEAAARYAAKIVEATQGSGDVYNRPAIMDGDQVSQLFTTMMTYPNTQAQQAMLLGLLAKEESASERKVRRDSGMPSNRARFYAFMSFTYVVAPIVEEIIRSLVNAFDPEPPDEEEVLAKVAFNIGTGPLGGMPILREFPSLMKGYGSDTAITDAVETYYKVAVQTGQLVTFDEEFDGERFIRAWAEFGTYRWGAPTKSMIRGFEIVTQEEFGRGR